MKVSKIVAAVLCVLAINFLWSTHNIAKADTVMKSNSKQYVRTTNLKVNKVIKTAKTKVVNKQKSNDRASRGGTYSSSITYSKTGNSIVNYSYRFLGRPYVWGGSGPSVFDCSGFTAYVYRKLGVSLPHYTVSQANLGKTVSRSNLRAGDLVFFNTSGRLSHVGIYIGGGNFIHASSGSHKVTVSNLGKSYYNSRYATARRIFN
ncbi:C40 family peptidase [Haloimpatiens sp. FM7330]|uniref:C40 family peptidase n=1 Tax=Haloimpatiens sp. FM7330 TaxID=3298610 RepID=UPI003631BA94